MEAQREWLETDYYQVLGVDRSASAKEISKAYRTLARKYHPDTNPGDNAAEDRFKEISAAYEVIGDESSRKKYDEFRRLGGGGFGGFGPQTGGGVGDLGDLSDLLGGLFGQSRGSAGRNFGFGPMPGADLQAKLTLSFEEAIKGVTKSVRLTSDVLSSPMEVNVRIPAGVRDGQRIRVAGKGGPPHGEGGESGDLLVTIGIKPHDVFDRDGDHLLVTVPVSYTDAVLGADVKVPTLEGVPVTVRIPPGTKSGKTLRVRGRGVQSSAKKGDLLVTVAVHVPDSVNSEERELLTKLRDIEQGAPRKDLGV
ncbi:MAG: DnaJ domain-containing protein [Acidimicrobiales bacterium]|nr:DnaJ domain-containing protein [Acidimicrobiales bacterium]RZV43907.1 MAG: J domain-containing protein [Acidimicrobiales bacterium]